MPRLSPPRVRPAIRTLTKGPVAAIAKSQRDNPEAGTVQGRAEGGRIASSSYRPQGLHRVGDGSDARGPRYRSRGHGHRLLSGLHLPRIAVECDGDPT